MIALEVKPEIYDRTLKAMKHSRTLFSATASYSQNETLECKNIKDLSCPRK